MERLLDLLALLALACVGATGLARAVALAARGVSVVPIDRQRSLPQALLDLAFLLGLLAWVYDAIATVVAPGLRLTAGLGCGPGIPTPIRWTGLATAVGGVALYGAALRELGASWRLTIDRGRPGPLVTSGVFARTRNPVYLSLALLGLGVSLALGSMALAVLASAALPYFHLLVLREERFLEGHYGRAYAAYRGHVPRWWRWRSSGKHER